MTLYVPHSIFHLAWLLYVRPETFGPYVIRAFVCYNEHVVTERHSFLSGRTNFEDVECRRMDMADLQHAGEEDADIENRASDADNEDKDEMKEGKYSFTI